MKKVIIIPEQEIKHDVWNPVQFTHRKGRNGWKRLVPGDGMNMPSESITKMVYLGKCQQDGDMFAVYHEGFIKIYKGHLNSGQY